MTGYPRPARPFWVYPIFGLYLLLLAAVLFSPLAVILSDGGFLPALVLSGGVLLFFGLGASLIAIPVGNLGALPHRQSSIAFPLIGSGICVALLAGAGAFAVDEWLHGTKSPLNGWEFGAVAGATWLLWTVFFYLVSRSLDRGTWNDRVYQALLAGSALELLVAIPMHLVVRRRTECCAGMMTALGIGVGITVMLIALGPAVFFLFHRRYRQAYARRGYKLGNG